MNYYFPFTLEPIEDFPEADLPKQKKSSKKDEPFELRAWPPVASEDRSKPRGKNENFLNPVPHNTDF